MYAKASPELKAVLEKARDAGFTQELDADAEEWEDQVRDRKLRGGFVYRVHPDTPAVEPEKGAPVRVELEWIAGIWGVILEGEGFWGATEMVSRRGFLVYEYPDGSRSQDFTRSKGLPVAAWFEAAETVK